jgi:mxaK protein
MKRRHLHIAFAVTGVIAASLAGDFAWCWREASLLNAGIAAASQSDAPMAEQASPESRLARAQALSRHGATDAAIKAYKALAQDERADIRQAALYNLGNLYLREALKDGSSAAVRHMPLIELAKQSYRTLLRMNGDDWDARYNLELALRLAPEYDDVPDENSEPAVPKERAVTTMQGRKLVLP